MATRRSARRDEQHQAQQASTTGEGRRNDPKDPTYATGEVPANPDTWAHGVTQGGVTFRAKYQSQNAEETCTLEYQRPNGKWRKKKPSRQNGYERFRFQVDNVEHEERRNRIFCYLVHGPPPGNPTDYHADHTSKVTVGGVERWARSTGPVEWLDRAAHGRKHGHEGAEEARKRSQTAQQQPAAKARTGDA